MVAHRLEESVLLLLLLLLPLVEFVYVRPAACAAHLLVEEAHLLVDWLENS